MKERHSGNGRVMTAGVWADGKTIFGVLSLVVSIAGYVPYFSSIIAGRCKPHAFSWVTWTMATALIFLAQCSKDAGPGAWVTGLTALACFLISLFSLRNGEKEITRSDEVIFGIGLAAIPLWAVTQDPLWSVLLMMGIISLGFYPTFRKSYDKPYEEHAFFYGTCVAKFFFGFLAVQHYSLVTALSPLFGMLINAAFLAMLLWRRRHLGGLHEPMNDNMAFEPEMLAMRIQARHNVS